MGTVAIEGGCSSVSEVPARYLDTHCTYTSSYPEDEGTRDVAMMLGI